MAGSTTNTLYAAILLLYMLSIVAAQLGDEPTVEHPMKHMVMEGHLDNESEHVLSATEDQQRSFFVSLLMIIVSEIGDKTFLIAAIMAMKHSRILIFSAAISALAVMSILSAFLGYAVPNLIPEIYTHYAAALLFFIFGIKMIADGLAMKGDEGAHEMEEVEEEIKEKEDKEKAEHLSAAEKGKDPALSDDATQGAKVQEGFLNLLQFLFSPTFVQTFVLTFLAEWGDRSQISTIALAAANNVYGVTLGTIVGHSMCTGVAVMGGRYLASKISVKTVTLVGAALFLCFAAIYLYEAVYGEW
ncbi:hypothetical protein BC936DRAFT_144644 [Jimgerdemannia flammicorona]|uniref:GDT1 family protein n=2 Tax=Jimgerdemannia flammicorona TaxID=994334 RepID=A0A433QIK6_9FUNG|nr:hypothetical protein BC936DRAFT_144644 [Jimgerdemannia flammicorona]RUS29656.1 hypothetical protein BC938DRAFT_480398 [Jimgerdemannia flammicorona]